MKMREDISMNNNNNNKCYYHPKQELLGVCPKCLNQRLVILAAKHRDHSKNTSTCKTKVSSVISIPFRSLFYFRYKRPHPRLDSTRTSSLHLTDDSFISIKFEDNGVASWDKRGSKSVVEHAKPRSVSLRWRKRISQLLHLIKWRKGSIQPRNVGGTDSHDRAWIRTLNIATKKN